MFPLKVNKVTIFEVHQSKPKAFVKLILHTCDNFPRMNEVYVGIYPSSIIRVKYSREIVLKCNLTVFDNQHDTD